MTLTANESQALSLFRELAAKLVDSSLMRSDVTKLSLKHSAGKSTFEGYDEDHYNSFVLTLRQFMLKKDVVRIDKICELILRECPTPALRSWTTYTLETWKQILKTDIGLIVSGKRFTLKEAIDHDWYGSGRIHSKLHEREAFKSLPEAITLNMKLETQNAIIELARMIVNIDAVLGSWAGDTSIQIPTPPPGY